MITASIIITGLFIIVVVLAFIVNMLDDRIRRIENDVRLLKEDWLFRTTPDKPIDYHTNEPN